jgi:antitoxin CptB
MPDPLISDPLAIRRKRLHFRSWHRGMKESDLILGRFANRHLEEFGEADLDLYEQLLEESDPEIFDWITGRVPLPPEMDNHVTRLLVSFTASA